MEKLRLENFGCIEVYYTTILDSENKISFFSKIQKDKKTRIVCNRSSDDENLIVISNDIITMKIINNKAINTSFNLHDLNASSADPIVVSYDNCNGSKTNIEYYHTINIFGKDISFIFDKDEIAIFNRDKCTVYKGENGEIGDKKPIKYIYFLPAYIVTKDLVNDIIIYEGIENKLYYEFKLFAKKQDYKFSMLSSLPTSVISEDKDLFYIGYDDQGIVSNMIDKVNNLHNICRYEATEDERISIHPLIYDAFDYRFIDSPYLYYAFDYLTWDQEAKVFQRSVYKITDKDKLLEYLNIINTSDEYKSKMMIELELIEET